MNSIKDIGSLVLTGLLFWLGFILFPEIMINYVCPILAFMLVFYFIKRIINDSNNNNSRS